MNATRTEQDLKLMQDQDRWPRWPFLPLKRQKRDGNDGIELGLLTDSDKTTVVLANLWELEQEKWADFQKLYYADLQAVQADGWLVD